MPFKSNPMEGHAGEMMALLRLWRRWCSLPAQAPAPEPQEPGRRARTYFAIFSLALKQKNAKYTKECNVHFVNSGSVAFFNQRKEMSTW